MNKAQMIHTLYKKLNYPMDKSQASQIKHQIFKLLSQIVNSSDIQMILATLPDKQILRQIVSIQSKQLQNAIYRIFIGSLVVQNFHEDIKKFIAKYVTNCQQLLLRFCELCQNSKVKCLQFLNMLYNYYKSVQKQQYGYITEIVIICSNLINSFAKYSNKIIIPALKILELFFENFKQLAESLNFENVALQMFKTHKDLGGYALKLLSSQIRNKVIQKYPNIDLNDRVTQGISFQNLQYSLRTPAKFEYYHSFFEGLSMFIYESNVMFNKFEFQQLNWQLLAIQNRQVFKYSLKSLEYFHMNLQIQYSEDQTSYFIRHFVRNSLPQKDKSVGKLFVETFNQYQQRFLTLIQQGIDNQFQYAFDQYQFNGACNCFYTLNISNKDRILNLLKSLLNLNESCETKSKHTIVLRIFDLIVCYSFIMDGNPFLVDVVEKLLIKHYPQTKQILKKLINEGYLTTNLINYFNELTKNLEYKEDVYEIILKLDKQFDNGEDYIIRNSIGKKMYEFQWNLDFQKLSQYQKMYEQYPLQYERQLILIKQLIG